MTHIDYMRINICRVMSVNADFSTHFDDESVSQLKYQWKSMIVLVKFWTTFLSLFSALNLCTRWHNCWHLGLDILACYTGYVHTIKLLTIIIEDSMCINSGKHQFVFLFLALVIYIWNLSEFICSLQSTEHIFRSFLY